MYIFEVTKLWHNVKDSIIEDCMKKGIYRHYKGSEYLVLGEVTREVDLVPMVVYQALYQDYRFWTRPKEEFLENITVDAYQGPRFAFLRIWTSEDEILHSQRLSL